MKNLLVKLISLLAIFMNLIMVYNSALAYDNEKTHPQINEKASRISANLEKVLKDIGFTKGVDDFLSIDTAKRIFDYFREGGTKEDEPLSRTMNHFHDPTKT